MTSSPSSLKLPVVGRAAAYALTALFLGLWVWQYISAPPGAIDRLAGLDYRNYAEATRTWLDGGTWYLERQLQGPYLVVPGDVLYPPVWLVLFVPAALAPWPLWWILPAVMVGWALYKLRPSPLGWATMAAFLAWPPTAVHLLTGNPTIWLVAALAMGTLYRWPSAFLLTKVTIAPLGLWGVRDRRWWVTVAGIVAASLLFLPMWPTYLQVLLDAKHPAGVFYSAQDVPLLMIPLVAWATSTRRSRT